MSVRVLNFKNFSQLNLNNLLMGRLNRQTFIIVDKTFGKITIKMKDA